MVKYSCVCGKEFTDKCDYTRHINKKFPCVDKTDVMNKMETFERILEELNQLKHDNEMLKKDNADLRIQVQELNNVAFKTSKTSRKSKAVCNNKHNNINSDNMSHNIENSNNHITNSNNQINNHYNNTNNNDIKVNFNVVAFGKENLDFITDDMCNSFCRGYQTIPNFVELVHFNKKKPEYSNVYMPNKKNKNEVLVFNGDKWILSDKNMIVEQLIDKGIDFVQGKLDELAKKNILSPSRLNSVKRFLDSYDTDETTEKTRLTRNIELILYNNKDFITKKLK